ncbi:hypothetical protein JNUCC74_01045 [Cerasibacillus sp. JNUCC 74]
MNQLEKIERLEKQVRDLEKNVMIMQNILLSRVPEWAVEPLEKVKEKGEVPFPFVKPNVYGSYDYYRLITLLINKKII